MLHLAIYWCHGFHTITSETISTPSFKVSVNNFSLHDWWHIHWYGNNQYPVDTFWYHLQYSHHHYMHMWTHRQYWCTWFNNDHTPHSTFVDITTVRDITLTCTGLTTSDMIADRVFITCISAKFKFVRIGATTKTSLMWTSKLPSKFSSPK